MREAVHRVLELGPSSGLTDRQFRVLLYLADRLNKRTGQLNPSAGRIARDIGLEPTRGNLSNVRRTIRELAKLGWLERPGWDDGVWDGGGRGYSRPTRLRAGLTDPNPPGKGVTRTPFRDGEGEPERVSEETRKGVTAMQERVSPGHPNLGSRTREEDLNPPTGSTSRVDATQQASTALSELDASELEDDDFTALRSPPTLADYKAVLGLDECAYQYEDGSIELSESGKLLKDRRAVRAFLTSPYPEGW